MAEILTGDVEVDGKLAAVNPAGEHALINGHTGPNGDPSQSNVLSLRHMSTGSGSAAVRIIEAAATDREVGAMGYQNGPGSFFLDGAMFMSAGMVNPDGSQPSVAPPKLILGQQGLYQSAIRNVARMLMDTDWSIHFRDPLGNDFLKMDADGTLHLLSAVKLSTTLDASAVPMNTATFIPAPTTETPTTWVNGAPGGNPAGFVKIMVGGSAAYMPYWR